MKEFTMEEMKDLLIRFAQNIMDYERQSCESISEDGRDPNEFVELFLMELKKQEKKTSCVISYECPSYEYMYRCKYFQHSETGLCAHRCLCSCTCKAAQIEELESEFNELYGR